MSSIACSSGVAPAARGQRHGSMTSAVSVRAADAPTADVPGASRAAGASQAGRLMSAAIVLAIVIATHDVDDQATEAMRATAAEALGSEDVVAVREVEVPSDAEALRIERSLRSKTVAEVVWLDAARTRARVRVHVVETNRWTERTIAFSSVDTPVERGRALGFAVTSMLPEEELAANPHRRPQQSGPAATPELRSSLRLTAAGSTGLGGGLGGGLAGEFFLTPALLVRLGFAGRQVTLDELKAGPTFPTPTDLVGYGAVGVGFWPLHAAPDRRVTAGVRVDLLASYHGVTREARDGTTKHQSTWTPGMDAMAELGWNVLGSFEIVTSLGIELAFEETILRIDDRDDGMVTDHPLPLIRGVAELGIRLSF